MKSTVQSEKLQNTFISLFYGVKVQRQVLPTNGSGTQYGESSGFTFGPGDLNLPLSPDGIQSALEQLRRTQIDSRQFEMAYQLPSCLWVYLNRFQYDPVTQSTQKMNDAQDVPH